MEIGFTMSSFVNASLLKSRWLVFYLQQLLNDYCIFSAVVFFFSFYKIKNLLTYCVTNTNYTMGRQTEPLVKKKNRFNRLIRSA